MKKHKIPIEISARHLHLSAKELEILFGRNYHLKSKKTISQPGQYACQETVKVVGPKNFFNTVRIVGPTRQHTQLEISLTDGYYLGIKPPVLVSGDYANSIGGVVLVGPKGKITMKKGIITTRRHLHLSLVQAKQWGLKHLNSVSININGARALVFHDVVIRSRKGIDELAFHVDTDEANAAYVKQGDWGELV